MHLRIAHLYPRRMSIYGDRGNVMALARRCRWRDVAVSLDEIEVGDKLEARRYDLFFFGGGQDQEQDVVAKDLARKSESLRESLLRGAALLAVCGGYQLLGRYYQPAEGERLEGAGIFPAHTEAGPKRFIGNVVAGGKSAGLEDSTLVGFENHSGLTWLDDGATALGRVKRGYGNNGRDKTEGCVAGGAVGTYLHGSLLPKNPVLADWLIARAFKRRHRDIRLRPLDDTLELRTQGAIARRFG